MCQAHYILAASFCQGIKATRQLLKNKYEATGKQVYNNFLANIDSYYQINGHNAIIQF